MHTKRSLALFAFEDMEVLDFAGPFEVFSVANQMEGYSLLDIKVVSKDGKLLKARNGLQIQPDTSLADLEQVDILVIPGGDGSKAVIEDLKVMLWMEHHIPETEITFSVCSGARILAKLGYLDGREYTTHHEVFEDVHTLTHGGIPNKTKRFVDLGQILTAGGISAGIDLSLHIVGRLFGQAVQKNTMKYMEYGEDWNHEK
ncbi:DJ-1/PfpI family protein [Pararhodonellum marinum]|uniref:DJ-1/PfpI family protein n=1 Tax=Pararhodonellum marinum TaxID=2755358 RepID=UPI00188EFB95|nr:DJ-1/PfpI family protein [Pararhodonellum marinum]